MYKVVRIWLTRTRDAVPSKCEISGDGGGPTVFVDFNI